MRDMDGEHLGANRIKLGFGKSMPSPVMWIDGVGDSVSEKYLTRQLARFGPILYTVLDKRKGHAMIFFEQTKSAVAAVQEMRGRSLGGRRLQVDFASKECQLYFLDSLEPSCIDRHWEREIRELIGRPASGRWNNAVNHVGDRRSRGTTRGRASTRSIDEFSQCSSGSREDLREGLEDPPSPFNSPRRYKVEFERTRRNRSSDSIGSDSEGKLRRRRRSDSVESIRLTSSRTRKASDREKDKIQLSHLTETEPAISSDSDSECPVKKTKLGSSDSGVSDISVGDRIAAGQAELGKECDRKLVSQPKLIPLESVKRREEGSRPGTPLCDELESEDYLPDPRCLRERTYSRPMCLPVPKWFDLLPAFQFEPPRVGRSPLSMTPKRDSSLPRSPVPADEECDSDSSSTVTVDRTLQEKLKQLDLMYEKWCSRTSGEYMPLSAEMTLGKYCDKPRIIDLELLKTRPSDILQCIISKRGVFDADFERLDRYSEKYEAKPIEGNDYLSRLQQLACSHLFRAQLPMDASQGQSVILKCDTKPLDSEEKSSDHSVMQNSESSPELGIVSSKLSVAEITDTLAVVNVKTETIIETKEECLDTSSVPEITSLEEKSIPTVDYLTPSPSDLTEVNLVPEPAVKKEVDEVTEQDTSMDVSESQSVNIDTPPSSIEVSDPKIVLCPDEKLNIGVTETEQLYECKVEGLLEMPETESIESAEIINVPILPVEDVKKEIVTTVSTVSRTNVPKEKKSGYKVEQLNVGSFESTLLGLEGPTVKVEQRGKSDSKAKVEKRRDESKSSRSSKHSSSRDSKSDKSDTQIKRKSTTDRDESKRLKLDDKSRDSSKGERSRHDSRKDRHSSKARSDDKHRQEKGDSRSEKSKSSSDKSRHESEKSKSKDSTKEERSKSSSKTSSRKFESKIREDLNKAESKPQENPSKLDRVKTPTPVVKTDEAPAIIPINTSLFFPDLSSSDEEPPEKGTQKHSLKPEEKTHSTPASDVSTKKDAKLSKTQTKKKKTFLLSSDGSDVEQEKGDICKPSPLSTNSKKSGIVEKASSKKETPKEEMRKSEDSKLNSPVLCKQEKNEVTKLEKLKKKLDTSDVFSSGESDEDKKKIKQTDKKSSPKKGSKKPDKEEDRKKKDEKSTVKKDKKSEKKLDVRHVFSSDESDEDSLPVIPSRSSDSVPRPRLFSSSDDETPPPAQSNAAKCNNASKTSDKGSAAPQKQEETEKSRSNQQGGTQNETKKSKSDVKFQLKKSPASSRYGNIYSSDDDDPKLEEPKSQDSIEPVSKSLSLLPESELSCEDERTEKESSHKKKKDKSGLSSTTSEMSKKNKVKKKKLSKEKIVYSSDEEDEKPKPKLPSSKAELKHKKDIFSSEDELDDLRQSHSNFSEHDLKAPSSHDVKEGLKDIQYCQDLKEADNKPMRSLSNREPKAKLESDQKSDLNIPLSKQCLSTDEDVKESQSRKSKYSTDTEAKPKIKVSNSEAQAKQYISEKEEHEKLKPITSQHKTNHLKSKQAEFNPVSNSEGESEGDVLGKLNQRKKSTKSLSDSESESDSDIPERNIFIVEEEPIYISMYDKVKARSCKRVSNTSTPATPSTEKRKSRKSSGYDSDRAKSALSSCDEHEKRQKKDKKKIEKIESDDEILKPKAKEDSGKKQKDKKKAVSESHDFETHIQELQDEDSLCFKQKKQKKNEPDVNTAIHSENYSPSLSFNKSENVESLLFDDERTENRPKPKPRARPSLALPSKIEMDEDPFDALLRTAKPYSPISSPRNFKMEERENIPEKKKKKKDRRESFEILSESNKNNGFLSPELMQLKSPLHDQLSDDKLLSPKSIKSEITELEEYPSTPTLPRTDEISEEAKLEKSKAHKKKKKEKKNKDEKTAKKHKKSRSKSPAACMNVKSEENESMSLKEEPVSPSPRNLHEIQVTETNIPFENATTEVKREELSSNSIFTSPEPLKSIPSPSLHDSSFEEIRPTSSLSQSSYGKAPRPVVISQKTEDAVAGLLEETFDFGCYNIKTEDEIALANERAEEDRSLLYEAQKALQSLAEENQPSPLLEQALAGLAEDDTFESKQDAIEEVVGGKDATEPFANWQQVESIDDKSSSRFSLLSPLPEESRVQSPKWASTFTAALTLPPTTPKEKSEEEKKETSWDLSSIMRRAMNAPSDTQRKPVITTPKREEQSMKHPAFDTIPTRPTRPRRGRKSTQEETEDGHDQVSKGRGGRRKARTSETDIGSSPAESPRESTVPSTVLSQSIENTQEQEDKNADKIEAKEKTSVSPRNMPVPRIQSPGSTRNLHVYIPSVDLQSPVTPVSNAPPSNRFQPSPQNQIATQNSHQPELMFLNPKLLSPPPVSIQANSQQLQMISPVASATSQSAIHGQIKSSEDNMIKEEILGERSEQGIVATTPTRPSGVIRTGSKLEQIANRLRPPDTKPTHFIPVAKVEIPAGFHPPVEQQKVETATLKTDRQSPGTPTPSGVQQRSGQAIISHGSHSQHTSPVKASPYPGLQPAALPPLQRDLLRSPEAIRIRSPVQGNTRLSQPPLSKNQLEVHHQNQVSQTSQVRSGPIMLQVNSQVSMQHHSNMGGQPIGEVTGNNQLMAHQSSYIPQQANVPRQILSQTQQNLQNQIGGQSHIRHTTPQQFGSSNTKQAHPHTSVHSNVAHSPQLPKQILSQQFQPLTPQPAPRQSLQHPTHLNPGHIPVSTQQMSKQPQQVSPRPLTPSQQTSTSRSTLQKGEHFVHRDPAYSAVRMPIGAHQQTPNLQTFNRTPLPAHQGASLASQVAPVHQVRSVTPAHQASKPSPYLSKDAPVGISPPLAHGGSTPMTIPIQKQLQQVREQVNVSPLTFRNPQHESREEVITPRVGTPGTVAPFDPSTVLGSRRGGSRGSSQGYREDTRIPPPAHQHGAKPEIVRQNSGGRTNPELGSAQLFYQQFLRAQQQPSGRAGFIANEERSSDSPIIYRSPPPAPHAPAAIPRAPTVQTPPQASQVPPQADSLLTLLNQRYPVMWQGLLALKNDQAAVQMHFISGNASVARGSLPRQPDGSTLPLRISQRMRLEQTQLEGVARKMQMEAEHCILLALPCGRDHMDVLQQSNNLKSGFITYLQCKQAAGIVNIAGPGSQQAAFVVHVFPSCEFGNENLSRIAPDLLHRISELAHLLVIIATV
ncbi:protein split ends-like isoform X3 [Artemia franciscana]